MTVLPDTRGMSRTERAEVLVHAARMLDKHIASVLREHGVNNAPFENCNLAAMELALQDYED